MKNFPGPVQGMLMFKYKEKTAFTHLLQYPDATSMERQRLQKSTFHAVFITRATLC